MLVQPQRLRLFIPHAALVQVDVRQNVAVNLQQIEPAVVINVDELRAESAEYVHLGRHLRAIGVVGKRAILRVVKQTV